VVQQQQRREKSRLNHTGHYFSPSEQPQKTSTMGPRVGIIYYSTYVFTTAAAGTRGGWKRASEDPLSLSLLTRPHLLHVDRYGHIRAMAEAVAQGVTAAGGEPVVRLRMIFNLFLSSAPSAPREDGLIFFSLFHVVDLPGPRDPPQGGPREDGCPSQGREHAIEFKQNWLTNQVDEFTHGPRASCPQADHPVLTHDKLDEFKELDGFLFGVPTRFGMMCAQMKAFFDSTGSTCDATTDMPNFILQPSVAVLTPTTPHLYPL
jgi:hypothetical protein